LEVAAPTVEDAHRLLYALRTFTRRVAKGGEGEHGNTRLIAEPAGDARCFHRDLRQILCARHLGDGRVRDQDGAATRQDDGYADDAVARLLVDDAAHVLECD